MSNRSGRWGAASMITVTALLGVGCGFVGGSAGCDGSAFAETSGLTVSQSLPATLPNQASITLPGIDTEPGAVRVDLTFFQEAIAAMRRDPYFSGNVGDQFVVVQAIPGSLNTGEANDDVVIIIETPHEIELPPGRNTWKACGEGYQGPLIPITDPESAPPSRFFSIWVLSDLTVKFINPYPSPEQLAGPTE